MKRPLFLFCLILTSVGYGQTGHFQKTPALGVQVAVFDFQGADSLNAFGKKVNTGLAISFQNNLSKRFDYSVTIAGSFMDFINRKKESLGDGKKHLLLEADYAIRIKLLPKPALFNPFVQGGAGVSVYNNYYGLFVPAGIGCQVNLNPGLFLLVNSQYRIPLTNTQNRHFYHSIGLAGVITKKKVTKPHPIVPTAPLPVLVQPVDSDGDGIPDSTDKCPSVAGQLQYQGCPVPDRDGDGINDIEDACPDVKGERLYRGCPPPDQDQDGVVDAKDKCPTIPGSAGNNGCPEIPVDLKNRIDSAAQQIFFETGSHLLLKRSFPALRAVIQTLQANTSINLIIEGHTDNTGTAANNKLLSRNRALSVMNYLIRSGIDPSRLEAIGFGQDKPVADNSTVAGRARNRRVVFVIRN